MKLEKIGILLLLFAIIGLGMNMNTVSATWVSHCWQHAEEGFILGTGEWSKDHKTQYPDNYYNWLKCADKDGDNSPPDKYYYKFAKDIVKAGYAKWLPTSKGLEVSHWEIQFTNKSTQSLNKKGYWEDYLETNWLVPDYRIRLFINTDPSYWKNPF